MATPAADDPRLQELHLDEIGTVYVVEDHRRDLVWVEVAFPTGSHDAWWVEHELDLRWPIAVGLALDDATSSARIEPWSNPMGFGVRATGFASDLDGLGEDLKRLLGPDLPRGTLPVRQQLRRARADRRASVQGRIDEEIARAFYHRKDPRRRAALLRGYHDVRGSELASLLRSAMRTPGVRVGLAGDLTVVDARRFLQEHLTVVGSGRRAAGEATTRPLAEPGRSLVVVDSAHAPEVLLVWARPGLAWADAEAPAAVLAEEVLRRRLTAALRYGRGDTYAVRVGSVGSRSPDVFRITTTTSLARAVEHRQAVEQILQQVAEEGFTSDEVARARERLRSTWSVRTGSPAEVLGEVMRRDRLATADPGLKGFAARVLGASEEQVAEAARALFAPESFVLFAAAPREVAKRLRESRWAGDSAGRPGKPRSHEDTE